MSKPGKSLLSICVAALGAPWGLQMEAISYPHGMAYEKDADTMLWTPK